MHRLTAALSLALAAVLASGCASRSFDAAPDGDLLRVERTPDALITALERANDHFAHAPDATTYRERDALAQSQSPPVGVLACADSRCAPEWVFEQRPGRLFVVREAGNVPDTQAIASLEYAVAMLDTRVLVVLGHSACGAVGAAASGKDPGTPALRALVASIEPAVAAHREHASGDELIGAAIDENVRRGVRALAENSPVLGAAVEAGTLRIVGAVHDLATGTVRFLD